MVEFIMGVIVFDFLIIVKLILTENLKIFIFA